jgi:hypothetical protein
MLPSFKTPRTTWNNPATITVSKKTLKSPKEIIEAATTVVKPAAGPDTASGEPLIKETTRPPMIPDRMPEYRGAPEARAIPMQSGKATRKTESPAGKSYLNQIRR